MSTWMTICFSTLFLLIPVTISGQWIEKEYLGPYLDLDAGGLIGEDLELFHQLSVGSGLQFSKRSALGAEFRLTGRNSCCNQRSMYGLGGQYRFFYQGIWAKISIGKVLSSSIGWDHEDQFRYNASGRYMSGTLGYRFQSGIQLGVNLIYADQIDFDYYRFDHNSLSYQFSHPEVLDFWTINAVIGWSWQKKENNNRP